MGLNGGLESARVPQRRRGDHLVQALLDAAWDELVERGYEAFTMDAVAARAETSRPVLYRRWPSKRELVRAVIGHASAKSRARVPDTGSLRGDVIALLKQANKNRIQLATLVSLHLGAYYRETGTSLADLRDVMGSGHREAVEQILARAVERGEADPRRLTPRVVEVPFDLFRQQILMTLKPVPTTTIEEIVDTIFLPLVSPDGRGRAA